MNGQRPCRPQPYGRKRSPRGSLWFLLGMFMVLGWQVSMVQAQNQEPLDVRDPDHDHAVITSAATTADQPTAPVRVADSDLALTNGISTATASLAETNAANQALAALAAGTGLALGAGLARGRTTTTLRDATTPWHWPPWAHTIAPTLMRRPPAYWQHVLQQGEDWLNTEFRVMREGDTILIQRLAGVRILASHPIATIQPGGIDFQWLTATHPTTPSVPPRAERSERPTLSRDELDRLLEETDDPYERYRLIRHHAPEQIVTQDTPTDQAGQDVRIITLPSVPRVTTGVAVQIGLHRGDDEPVDPIFPTHIPIPPDAHIESFILMDPLAQEQAFRYHWVVLPRPVIDDPDGTFRWPDPGLHTIVYEVTEPGQLPTYYLLEQEVVHPTTLAADYLREEPILHDPEAYLLALEDQLHQRQQLLDALDPGPSVQLFPDSSLPPNHQLVALRAEVARLRAGLDHARELLAAGGVPIHAVLIPDELLRPLPLRLFLQETDTGYAIIDLTNPSPGVGGTYRGATIAAAWQNFVDNTALPAGQLAATPPAGATATEVRWNTRIDGSSTLAEWSAGAGTASIVALVAGGILLFVPGAQGMGMYLLVTSTGAQLVATGVNVYDRYQREILVWNNETMRDLLDGASAVAGGVGALGRRVGGVRQGINQSRWLREQTDLGADLGSHLFQFADYQDRLAAIDRNPQLTEAERERARNAIVLEALTHHGVGAFLRFGVGPIISRQMDQHRLQTLYTQREVEPNQQAAFLQESRVQAWQADDPTTVAHVLEYPGFVSYAVADPTLIDAVLADGIAVVRVLDAAHAAGLEPDTARQLLNTARAMGPEHLATLGTLALEGRLTAVLDAEVDTHQVRDLLRTYDQAGMATLADLLQHGMPLARAQRMLTNAHDLGLAHDRDLMSLVHDLVTSGRFHSITSLAGQLEILRFHTDLTGDQQARRIRQLEEALQRVQQEHTVALSRAPNQLGRGDIIDLTTEEVLQLEVITGTEASTVTDAIQRAANQFVRDVPPPGFQRIIDLRIDHPDHPFAHLDRANLVAALRTTLDPRTLLRVDEIRMTTDSTTHLIPLHELHWGR